jgi:hypothetical protein
MFQVGSGLEMTVYVYFCVENECNRQNAKCKGGGAATKDAATRVSHVISFELVVFSFLFLVAFFRK